MFLVCCACHKVVEEREPLRNTRIIETVCEECQHETTLRYMNMLNKLYYEEEKLLLELEAGTAKPQTHP